MACHSQRKAGEPSQSSQHGSREAFRKCCGCGGWSSQSFCERQTDLKVYGSSCTSSSLSSCSWENVQVQLVVVLELWDEPLFPAVKRHDRGSGNELGELGPRPAYQDNALVFTQYDGWTPPISAGHPGAYANDPSLVRGRAKRAEGTATVIDGRTWVFITRVPFHVCTLHSCHMSVGRSCEMHVSEARGCFHRSRMELRINRVCLVLPSL